MHAHVRYLHPTIHLLGAAMVHFLLATFPAQGHINPSLQFAKRLIRTGAQVTFSTSVYAHRCMLNNNSTPLPDGLTLIPFSDGYDNGTKPSDHATNFMSVFKRQGSINLRKIILDLADKGRPVTCVIYTMLLPWAAELAWDLKIPSTLLWIQPATTFNIYHHYFHDYKDMIGNHNDDPSYLIELPGLPALTCRDIPSFFLSSSPHTFILGGYEEQFKMLEEGRNKEKSPVRVLVNTFDAFEYNALMVDANKYNLFGIGPLIPSGFWNDSKDPSDTSFGGDLFNGSKDSCIDWLNSNEPSSVVYISFGTVAVLQKKQMEEIARALADTGRPFLWVIRTSSDANDEDKEKEEMVLGLIKEKQQGLIVPWCSQVEVLNHPSVGCCVIHCGWSSTLECLVAGVPVVAFPQWADQATNAKLIQDVCRTGVRVKVKEDKILESEELKSCLDMVMGGVKGEEMRLNAKKWKDLARKAVQGGGSSDRNLLSFVEEIAHAC